jgi:hypothetical protein
MLRRWAMKTGDRNRTAVWTTLKTSVPTFLSGVHLPRTQSGKVREAKLP